MTPADFSKEDIISGKMYAVLSYLSVLCIVPLILKKNNAFVLSHGKQGLVLFMAETGALLFSIILPWTLRPLLFVLFGFSFGGMIQVVCGRFVALPLVGRVAQQIEL